MIQPSHSTQPNRIIQTIKLNPINSANTTQPDLTKASYTIHLPQQTLRDKHNLINFHSIQINSKSPPQLNQTFTTIQWNTTKSTNSTQSTLT